MRKTAWVASSAAAGSRSWAQGGRVNDMGVGADGGGEVFGGEVCHHPVLDGE